MEYMTIFSIVSFLSDSVLTFASIIVLPHSNPSRICILRCIVGLDLSTRCNGKSLWGRAAGTHSLPLRSAVLHRTEEGALQEEGLGGAAVVGRAHRQAQSSVRFKERASLKNRCLFSILRLL